MNTNLQRIVYDAPELDPYRGVLLEWPTLIEPTELAASSGLVSVKEGAVASGNQSLASAIWCIQRIAEAQDYYLTALKLCKRGAFYGGWCELEKAEIRLTWLRRHFVDSEDKFGVRVLCDRIPKIQSLFPYRLFFSPGLLIKKAKCSICDEVISPRKSCGHRRFKLYDGEMCGRVIVECEALEVSIVERPVQKYSVAFPQGLGSYNYGLVDYLMKGIASPWSDWEVEVQKRRRAKPDYDPQRYRGLGRNHPCACGSGRKFKKCCLDNMTEEYEHSLFLFKDGPPAGLPNYLPNVFVAGVDEPTAELDRLSTMQVPEELT